MVGFNATSLAGKDPRCGQERRSENDARKAKKFDNQKKGCFSLLTGVNSKYRLSSFETAQQINSDKKVDCLPE